MVSAYFADTSFLCAVLRVQDNTPQAVACAHKIDAPIAISSLILFEFRHSSRLQTFLFDRDRTLGFSAAESATILDAFRKRMDSGAFIVASVEWAEVYSCAERLSVQFAQELGVRPLDLLHVATALHLGARYFLTMDALQAKLAKAAGLKVKPG